MSPFGLDDGAHLVQNRFLTLFRWSDEELALVLADVLSEEVEAIVDVSNGSLFFGQC